MDGDFTVMRQENSGYGMASIVDSWDLAQFNTGPARDISTVAEVARHVVSNPFKVPVTCRIQGWGDNGVIIQNTGVYLVPLGGPPFATGVASFTISPGEDVTLILMDYGVVAEAHVTTTIEAP
jgi:hypothetical protein